MKRIALLILIFLGINLVKSQETFHLTSKVGEQKVLINGVSYNIDSAETEIPTNFPNFDTLRFESPRHPKVPIICNFKPDTTYYISLACCAEFDIIPMSKYNNDSVILMNKSEDFEKIKNHFWDKPFISIKTKEKPKDSIFAWHTDAACFTEHKLISTDLWRLGIPPKCHYWTNITVISFIKQDNTRTNHQKTDLEEFLEKDNLTELAKIYFRLFDDQRFILIFDEENKSIEIKYE